MTDAEYETEKERVKQCFEHWTYRFGLRCSWVFDFFYFRHAKPEDEVSGRGNMWADITYMEIVPVWERCYASIGVYTSNTLPLSDRDLSRKVIHELCHALTNEMREPDNNRKHEERAIAGLTSAFMYVTDPDEIVPDDCRFPMAATGQPASAATEEADSGKDGQSDV